MVIDVDNLTAWYKNWIVAFVGDPAGQAFICSIRGKLVYADIPGSFPYGLYSQYLTVHAGRSVLDDDQIAVADDVALLSGTPPASSIYRFTFLDGPILEQASEYTLRMRAVGENYPSWGVEPVAYLNKIYCGSALDPPQWRDDFNSGGGDPTVIHSFRARTWLEEDPMAIPASIITGAGLRQVVVYEIDTADGLPAAAAVDITFNAGTLAQGARVLTANAPGARRVAHVGDDRWQGFTVLPPLEGMTAEFRSGKKNFTLEALLLGQNILTVGASKYHGIGTDRVGYEIQVAVLAFGSSEDRDDASATKGQQQWQSLFFPKAWLTSRRGNMDDSDYEHTFDITANPSTKFPWGVALVLATHGYTEAQAFEGSHTGMPRLLVATGDGSTLIFPFPSGITAINATTGVTVFIAGAEVTANLTKTTTGITFGAGSAPAAGAKVFVLVETT